MIDVVRRIRRRANRIPALPSLPRQIENGHHVVVRASNPQLILVSEHLVHVAKRERRRKRVDEPHPIVEHEYPTALLVSGRF